jgi:hypothetical protein
MIESNVDRLAFFNPDEFGVGAILTSSSSGSECEVVGIFDNQHLSLDLGAGTVSTSELQFMCRTSDVVGYTQGDKLDLDGVSYEITDVQADGTGITTLKLHRV